MEKELKELKKQLIEYIDNTIDKHIQSNKPLEFSKGWNYIKDDYNFEWLVLNPKVNDKNEICYDLNFDLKFKLLHENDFLGYLHKTKSHRPATPEEIKSCLVKHCESLGIKEGVTINRDLFNLEYIKGTVKLDSNQMFNKINHVYYCPNVDSLDIGDYCVYSRGKFAKVVKDEAIKIGGYNVNINKTMIHVGCQIFNINDIIILKKIMDNLNIESITVRGITVSIDIINKILSKT